MIDTTRTGDGSAGNPKIANIHITKYVGKNEHGIFDETIYWKWPFQTIPGEEINSADLIDSEDMGKVATASINVTGFEILNYDQLADGVAEVNGTRYDTLQEAIDAVSTDNTETIVRLLKDTSENVTVNAGKNIIFNLQDYTLSNSISDAIITNFGTIKITNGTLYQTATNVAVINNKPSAKAIVTGGNIIVIDGGRQAIYNTGGIVEISGTAYLKSEGSSGTNQRATVQNLSGGTLNITGGTIISTNFNAVNNAATMTIGTKDGNVNSNSPLIQGGEYGITSTAKYNYYDGIMKGKTAGVDDISKIIDIEPGYGIVTSDEVIDGVTYKTASLTASLIVTFNGNGGNVIGNTKAVVYGDVVGAFPITTRAGYELDGYFTAKNGGEQITENTVVTGNVTYYAHWTKVVIAELNGTQYGTLQEAINKVGTDNTETTIKLLRNTTEAITIKKNQNIVLDAQNYKISSNGNKPVITNNGTLALSSGTIESDVDYATIDNNSGAKLIVTGGNIISNGTRSSIYNAGGIVEISGDAYLSSTATGKPTGTVLERGTISNLQKGVVTITGGTIIGVNQQAISNEATLIIGVKNDGNINASSPVIVGKTYGIRNTSTFNYYDGIVKGVTDAIDGVITETETNSTQINSTETIDGVNYKTTHLE